MNNCFNGGQKHLFNTVTDDLCGSLVDICKMAAVSDYLKAIIGIVSKGSEIAFALSQGILMLIEGKYHAVERINQCSQFIFSFKIDQIMQSGFIRDCFHMAGDERKR